MAPPECSPNSQPTGAKAGVPAYTRLYSRQVTQTAQQIVLPTSENRIITLLAPLVGEPISIGTDAGVTAGGAAGVTLPPGVAYTITLVGLQELYAITSSPTALPLQIQVSIILMAERERITSAHER